MRRADQNLTRLGRAKRVVARLFNRFGVFGLGHWLQMRLYSPFIRVVNYHIVDADDVPNFERQLRFFARRFVPVNERDLRGLLAGGVWPHDKPGLVMSFDDGHRSHFETVAPILERHGFAGWFFVPIGHVETGEADAMTLDQLRSLDRRHVVGCHTDTHPRLKATLPHEALRREVLGAKAKMERHLARPVRIFCWVGGEEDAYSKAAAELVAEGFDLSFMTNNAVVTAGTNPLQIQRTNIEAFDPLYLVNFQLSGLMDLAYAAKRRRVNDLTRMR